MGRGGDWRLRGVKVVDERVGWLVLEMRGLQMFEEGLYSTMCLSLTVDACYAIHSTKKQHGGAFGTPKRAGESESVDVACRLMGCTTSYELSSAVDRCLYAAACDDNEVSMGAGQI